jgi:DNA-binding NarL/FixJ family response regulator
VEGHSLQVLVQAIEHVFAGRAWFDSSLLADVVAENARAIGGESDPEAAKIASLTERERTVISLICEGLQNKLIADRMAISETTVRHHLTSIFAKLSLDSRLELVIYAYRQGLAKIPERA